VGNQAFYILLDFCVYTLLGFTVNAGLQERRARGVFALGERVLVSMTCLGKELSFL
jgi:hypothetical protein